MAPSLVFATGLAVTLLAALLVVLYLRRSLDPILVDLCGTAGRAHFWTAFSNVALILVPTIFALQYRPASESAMQLSAQFQSALIGLAIAVFALGLVLALFIRRELSQQRQVPADDRVGGESGQ